jgi:hypothetical protein
LGPRGVFGGLSRGIPPCQQKSYPGCKDRALDLMADAMDAFRSKRVTIAQGDDLSFISEGSGFEVPRTEHGNWFTRGALTVFEYRFRG